MYTAGGIQILLVESKGATYFAILLPPVPKWAAMHFVAIVAPCSRTRGICHRCRHQGGECALLSERLAKLHLYEFAQGSNEDGSRLSFRLMSSLVPPFPPA